MFWKRKKTQIEAPICPFLKTECIKEKCLFTAKLKQVSTAGTLQQLEICSVNALVLILSEINQKTQVPQQAFRIPNLRGN
jgi:hypothetical protein